MHIDRGNLPTEFQLRSFAQLTANENPIVLPTLAQKNISIPGFELGTVIQAVIRESAIAFPESKVPIRAIVASGTQRGSILLGEATLERNSKRITIEFKKLRLARGNETYELVANALDATGTLGLEGEYESNEGKLLSAELLASAVAGFSDATLERTVGPFGQPLETPSLSNASKKAASSSLTKMAERLGEKVKQAPEYSVLQGPIRIQVLIQSTLKSIE